MHQIPWLILALLLAACATSHVPREPVLSVEAGEPCTGPGWCWERGTPLTAMAGNSLSSVHAFGVSGHFLRWVGDGWMTDPVPTPRRLESAWIGEDGTSWAVDAEQALWINDGSWRNTGENFLSVFGAADQSVWVESEQGPLMRVGDQWQQVFIIPEYCAQTGLVILAPNDVWTAGLQCSDDSVRGELHHLDGSNWRPVAAPVSIGRGYPMLEAHANTVRFRADFGGNVFDRVGSSWEAVTEPNPSDFEGPEVCEAELTVEGQTWCSGKGQIYQRRGAEWLPTLPDRYARTMTPDQWGQVPVELWVGGHTRVAWGSGPRDVYRVQAQPDAPVEHFDGRSWTVYSDEGVHDISGTARDNVWFATQQQLLHFDGTTHRVTVPIEFAEDGIVQVHALSGEAVIIASQTNQLALYDGSWSVLRERGDSIVDLAGTGPDDIWILEHPICRCDYRARWQHFDGSEWEEGEWGSGTAFGQSGNRIWMLSFSDSDTIQPLRPEGPAIAGDWMPGFSSTLSLADDRFWITTPWQARSFGPSR